jgi:putrescine importer
VLSSGFAGLIRPDAIVNPHTFDLGRLMLGAGIATLSYLGFDAVSTMTEDSRNPEADIGFATVAVCLLQAVFCFLIVYLASLVWPAAKPFANAETAVLDISTVIGGAAMFSFTMPMLIVAAVASSITSQAGASRLLYGMGRDGVLPRSIFGYLDPIRSSPVRSMYVMGIISFVGAMLVSFQVVVELVNFGAFVGFVLVNLGVIGHYYLRLRLRLGRHLWTNLVLPALGAVVCVAVWMNLSPNAKLVGFVWFAIGLVYLGYLSRGFRKPAVALELP